MARGKILTLFSDWTEEKQEAIYPRTKVDAISDKNGNGLSSLLENKQDKLKTVQVTLTQAGWENNWQEIVVEEASETNTIIVSSAPENIETYTSDGVYCLGQSEGKLTFACVSTPKTNLIANVMILN